MKELLLLIKQAAGQGNRLYLVGGYLRDRLMGRNSRDLDFTVRTAAKKTALNLASALKTSPITLDHENDTYRIIHPLTRQCVDISRMQGPSILADLARRDFTINALASSNLETPFRSIIDPYGGIKDIERKQIRIVSGSVLNDDPIRLIRAFRFSAELNFAIDKKTLSDIRKKVHLIRRSAGERVRDELFKICATDSCARTIMQMDRIRLLTAIIPELESCRHVARRYYGHNGLIKHCLSSVHQMDTIVHMRKKLFGRSAGHLQQHMFSTDLGGIPRFILLKLAALLHDIGKPQTARMIKSRMRFFEHEEKGAQMIRSISDRLKLSRKQSHLLQTIARAHMRPGNLACVEVITDRAIHRFFKDYGDEAVDVLLVSLADRFSYISARTIARKTDRHHTTILKLLHTYYHKKNSILPQKLIDGRTLMSRLNLAESPLIGKLLTDIEEAHVQKKIKTPEQAVTFARGLLADKNPGSSIT